MHVVNGRQLPLGKIMHEILESRLANGTVSSCYITGVKLLVGKIISKFPWLAAQLGAL